MSNPLLSTEGVRNRIGHPMQPRSYEEARVSISREELQSHTPPTDEVQSRAAFRRRATTETHDAALISAASARVPCTDASPTSRTTHSSLLTVMTASRAIYFT